MTETTVVSAERQGAMEYLTERTAALTALQIHARVRTAVAGFEAALEGVDEHEPASTVTARTILVVNRVLPGDGVEPEIFEAELDWKGYAMVQRWHLLDHRNQVRKIRARGESQA